MPFFVWAGDNHDKLRPAAEENCDRQKHVSRVQRLGPDSYRVQPLNCDWAHNCKCLGWPITLYYWVHWPIRGQPNNTSVCIISGTSDICTQSVWSHHFLCFCMWHHFKFTSLSQIYSCTGVKYPFVKNNDCQIIQYSIFAISFSIVQWHRQKRTDEKNILFV